jgi:hypothetical protein
MDDLQPFGGFILLYVHHHPVRDSDIIATGKKYQFLRSESVSKCVIKMITATIADSPIPIMASSGC